MTPTQRTAMERAMAFCEAWPGFGGKKTANALRAALAEPASAQEPVVCRESSWFALVMNAAAEIEDASNCLRDPDAKRTAIRGAEYYRNAAKAMSKAQPAVEPAPVQEPETVSVYGVKSNGEVVDTGVKAPMPPRMKAKEMVREMFGPWDEDNGSDSDLCFAVCEQFFEWLISQGWTAPQAQQEKS